MIRQPSCCDDSLLLELGAHLRGGAMAMALNQPVAVESRLEVQQRLAQLLDGIKALYPEQLLLEGADEPLRDAVALRCSRTPW